MVQAERAHPDSTAIDAAICRNRFSDDGSEFGLAFGAMHDKPCEWSVRPKRPKGDLIMAFGTNGVAGTQHFVHHGFFEGRSNSFDAEQYLANYADLQAAFGSDLDAEQIARRAMQVAAEICVFTNENVTVEKLDKTN